MKKLTEREKMLLITLFTALFLIIGIMYWVLPTRDRLRSMEIEKNELLNRQLMMDTKIAQTDKLLENKEELIKEVDVMMNHLSDPLLGENFDLQAQSLASLNGIKINSLHYGTTQVISPSALGTPTEQYEYNLKQLVDIYLGYEASENSDVKTDHEVLKKTVTMDVTGSYLSTQKLLRDLNNMGSTYYVRSVTYSRSDSERQAEDGSVIETITSEKASIEVDVYFIETDRSSDINSPNKG